MLQAALTALALAALDGELAPASTPPAAVQVEGASGLASLESEQSRLFAKVAPSVVLLVRDGVSGSGFVVEPGGLVLTNAHVVGDAAEVAVQLFDGRFGRAQVVARATGSLDLALVRIPFADVPALPAGEPGAVRSGTYAATVGHGGGAAWTFSTGLVANPRPLGDGAPLLLAQMALRPGSSGGPLVDRRGRAVGIVTAGTRDASGVTFAIRADVAAAVFPQLAGWGARPSPGPVAQPIAAAAPEQAVAPPPAEVAVGVPPAASPARPPDVARLSSGPQAALPPPRLEPAPGPMVTVWEAPRPARRVSARAPRARASVPSHEDVALPPARPPPAELGLDAVLLAVVAAAAAGAFALRARSPR